MENSPFQNQCPIAPPASSSVFQCDEQAQLNQDLTVLCHKMVHATRISENLNNSGQVPRSFVQCGRPLSKKSKSTATSGGTSTNSLIYGLTTESEFPHFYPQPFSTNHSEPGLDLSSSYSSKDMFSAAIPESIHCNMLPVSSSNFKKCGQHFPIEKNHTGTYPGCTGDLYNGIDVSSDSDRMNTMLSGCPRVFCSTTRGFLLISSSALLGVVCSCHRTHMSVLKFCEHSGVHNVNPGYAVIVDRGDTIAQWRKYYFGKLRIRVPGDHCEWDWPEGFSGIANMHTSATQGHYRNGVLFPDNPEAGFPVTKFLHAGHHGHSLKTHNFVFRGSNNSKSFSNLETNKKMIGGMGSDGSELLSLAGLKEAHHVCYSTSDQKDSSSKLENCPISFSDLWNLKCNGKNFNQRNFDGTLEDTDSISSECELKLGQPSDFNCYPSLEDGGNMQMFAAQDPVESCNRNDVHRSTRSVRESQMFKMSCDKAQDFFCSSIPGGSKVVSGSQKTHLTHWMGAETSELAPFNGLAKDYNLSALSRKAGGTKTKKRQHLHDVCSPEQSLLRNITGVVTTFDSNVSCKHIYRSATSTTQYRDREVHGMSKVESNSSQWRDVPRKLTAPCDLITKEQTHGSIKMNGNSDWKTIKAEAVFSNSINISAQDAMMMKEQELYKHNLGYSPPILSKVSFGTNKNSPTINTVGNRCKNNSTVDDWSRISSNCKSYGFYPAALSRGRDFHGIAQWEEFEIENQEKRKFNHETSKKVKLKRKRLHCSFTKRGEVHIGESYPGNSFSGASSGHQAIFFEQKVKPIVCHKYGIIINGSRRKQAKIVSIENVLLVAKRTSVTEKYKVLGLLQREVEGHTDDEVGFYKYCVNHAMLKQSNADDCTTGKEEESTCSRTLEKSNAYDCTSLKKEESICSRTEGYKDRKCFCSWSSVSHCHDGDYRCHVPQDQLNVWLHIHDHKSFPRGRLGSQKTEFEYDNREQYARFKQSKGWKHLLLYKSIIHGLGLYTSRFIPRGDMVVEYVGEVVGPRVADKREAEYQSGKKLQYKGACYLFKVDKEHIIDGTRKGGIARFVNHSCLPNCVAKVICVRNEKKVVFYADREIYPGEEVTYDYHFNKEAEGEKIPCNCRSRNCRRYLN